MNWNEQSDQYARVSRMLGYALTLGDNPRVWDALAIVLAKRLTRNEQARLLRVALLAAHPDDIDAVLTIYHSGAGYPMPGIAEAENEARCWADIANRAELKAWLAACYVRLPRWEQEAFLAIAARGAAK